MPATRRFVGAALLICVVAPGLPNGARRTPPLDPTTQKRLPSSVTAPLTSNPVSDVGDRRRRVDESVPVDARHDPGRRCRRCPATAAVPRSASNPARLRYRPSAESARAPSEVAEPLKVSRRFAPTDRRRQSDRLHERPRRCVLVEEHCGRPAAQRRTPIADPHHHDVARGESRGGCRGRRPEPPRRSTRRARPPADRQTRWSTCTHGNSHLRSIPPARRDSTGGADFDGGRPRVNGE